MTRINEIPEIQQRSICRAVIGITREQFEKPEIRQEFARWKEQRAMKKGAPSCRKAETPRVNGLILKPSAF